jgi:cytochrome P450
LTEIKRLAAMDALIGNQSGRRRVADLPGPAGIPILGNALALKPGHAHEVVEAWARQYGDYFRFRIGSRHILGVADPHAIQAVLKDRPDTFLRTARLVSVGREVGLTGLFFANGDAWRRQRRMVMAAFDPVHVKRYFPSLEKVTGRLQRRWREAALANRAIPLQADLMRYTVDVTAGLAFGTDINTLESTSEVIQSHLDQVMPMLSRRLIAPFTYWRWVKLPADRRFDRHLRAIHQAISQFIAHARKRMEADPALRDDPRNLIEAMIAARDAGDSGLTDDDVAGNVFTMLLAGEDTTANTLAWLIYLLSRNPQAMQAARDEVERALAGGDSLTQFEQVNALPYLQGCIDETMRLKPVAPMIFTQAGRDTVVGDIAVPEGGLLLLVMRAGALGAQYFPDAARFEPGRWLDAARPEPEQPQARRVSMPFGAGPRLCPGRYLALLEIKMVASMLLATFDIERVESVNGGDARERLDFTMAPAPLRMRLKARGI